METNDDFNRIMEMNTEVERRHIAAQIVTAMAYEWFTYSDEDRYVCEDGVDPYKSLAQVAVNAADALIAELNKKKDGNVD